MLHIQKKGIVVKAQYSVLLLLFLSSFLYSKLPLSNFNCSISGYIKGEAYSDSRQTVDAEIYDISFFPARQKYDPEHEDINARGQTLFDAFETRIGITCDGIKIKQADLKTFLEVDFEIFAANITNLPHMRHAYGELTWKNTTLLFGQTWHPVVLAEPKTINYSGANPFDYYARSPQLTVTHRPQPHIAIIGSASMQVDYVSDGPYGLSSQYMRWATIPNLDLQIRWLLNNYMINIGIDYKRIAPRIESATLFKVHERLSSLSFFLNTRFTWQLVEMITKINFGQNASDFSGMGGYAVQKGSINQITDHRKYTNLNNIACFTDIELTKNKKFKPGMFIGFSKNLGASTLIEHNIVDEQGTILDKRIFGFVPDVNNAFRISTRLIGIIKNITIGGEVEYTRAAYGDILNNGTVVNTKPVECIRCTFATYYYF